MNDLYEQNQEYIDTIAELTKDKKRLQKQLDIAVKALYLLLTGQKTIRIGKSVELIETFALRKIEELDNEIHKQE